MSIYGRTPIPGEVDSRVIKCANRFCKKDLRTIKVVIAYRGYGYCSKSCKKDWPPIINHIQKEYEAPIELVLEISLKLFRSKRRTAEILNISTAVLDKLVRRFKKSLILANN